MPRPSVDYSYYRKSEWKKFLIENPDIDISFEDFKRVVKTHNEVMIEDLLKNKGSVRLPFGLGVLFVEKRRQILTHKCADGVVRNVLPIDWARTKLEKKLVRTRNDHTDGWRCRYKWDFISARFRGSRLWKMRMSRYASRRLAHVLKSDDYHDSLMIYKKR